MPVLIGIVQLIQNKGHLGSYAFIFLEVFETEGGIQSYIQTLLRAYSALKNVPQAHVFILRDASQGGNSLQSEQLNFSYFKSRWPQWGRIHLAVKLMAYLLQHRPQRVFCGHVNLVPLVQVLCQPFGIPYTVITYGKEVWHPLPSRMKQGLQAAASIWTISRYSLKQACTANGLNPEQWHLLSCIVDGAAFTPGPKSRQLLEKYHLLDSQVLMTVARLWSGDPYKGVDVTIRALPAIAQRFPAVKYLVVGRGDDQPRLARLAQELGVADRVIFAGFVPTSELVDHYRLADAYVMPSQEGFGIVYLEAMACGKPVLSGDDDGSADPLQDGKLGWQVPHRDPEAVAVACIEILRGGQKRCDGVWLREQALALFGFDAFTRQLQQLLTSE
ncbi:glycosyl transferase group 1 [Leptolyngbya sp. 'hensonii']|nr:glycosyl transferase group 1 [Leptolyngbya sp. 'hensonii']